MKRDRHDGKRGDRAMTVLRVEPPQEAAGNRESEPHYGARVPSVFSTSTESASAVW